MLDHRQIYRIFLKYINPSRFGCLLEHPDDSSRRQINIPARTGTTTTTTTTATATAKTQESNKHRL